MKNLPMINFSSSNTETLPFPHFVSFSNLSKDLLHIIYNSLRATNNWKLVETDFYEQYEFSLLDSDLSSDFKVLISSDFVSLIKKQFQSQFKINTLQLVDVVAHKLIKNQKIGVHNDFIGGDETHRLVLHFNPDWVEDNGGFLLLFNSSDADDISKIISPLNNSAFGFEISKSSYHAVSKIFNFIRYTIVYTFKHV